MYAMDRLRNHTKKVKHIKYHKIYHFFPMFDHVFLLYVSSSPGPPKGSSSLAPGFAETKRETGLKGVEDVENKLCFFWLVFLSETRGFSVHRA